MKISAIIITHNEERNIGRCIDSLAEVADEIVVVDSMSNDRTQEICKEKGARFIQREWTNYSDQKNFANEQASGDYILSIDADEAISDDLKASILTIKSNPSSKVYSMNRLTNYCGKWIKHCGWYPDTKTRIWEKGYARWQGTIHETLKLESNQVEHLSGDLFHYSYYSVSQHIGQINRFTDLQAQELIAKGKKPNLLKLVLSPPFKFFQKYIIQGGFKDGKEGYVISKMAAYYVFCKHAKHRVLHDKQ